MEQTEAEKEAYKEKIRSIGFRARQPRNKVTEHHTDTAIVTETEHWEDRQDLDVKMQKPITIKANDKES